MQRPAVASRHKTYTQKFISGNMNRLQVSGLIITVVLIGLSVYSGTLADPYYDRDYRVSVGESVDPQYAQYQYTELSLPSQRLFDQNTEIKQKPSLRADERYGADVCRKFTVVCNGYQPQNLPDEFEYDGQIAEKSILVQKGNTQYRFSIRRSDYYPAADSIGPNGKEATEGFLRLLTLFSGLFIGTVAINSSYKVGLNRRQLTKIIFGLISVITVIVFVRSLFFTPVNIPASEILFIFVLIPVLLTLLALIFLIPILLGVKTKKDDRTIQKSIIGGVAIAGFAFITPYLEMYDVINISLAKQMYLLFLIIYTLGMFSDYIKKVIFQSPRNPPE